MYFYRQQFKKKSVRMLNQQAQLISCIDHRWYLSFARRMVITNYQIYLYVYNRIIIYVEAFVITV